MIQDKEAARDLFYKDVWSSIRTFLAKHPSKILHPHQRQRLLKGLCRYLEDDHQCLQYIEVDFHDRESKNPYGSLENIEEEALLLPMSLQDSNNQTLEVTEKMNLIHISEHNYQDQMLQSRLEPRVEASKQSESDFSESISKSIQEREKEAQNRRFTRLYSRQINEESKEMVLEKNANANVKIEHEQNQNLQANVATSRQKQSSRQIQYAQESFDESETYLYYQQKYKCNNGTNRINHPHKISNKITKSKPKMPKMQLKQDSEKKYGNKGRKPEFPEMEKKLIAWIEKMCKNKVRITQAIIRNRAMTIVKQLPYGMNQFRASKGWMEKFFKRHNEIFKLLSRNKMDSVEYFEDEACGRIEDQRHGDEDSEYFEE